MKKIIIALFILSFIGCSPTLFNSKWTKEIAPDSYVTRFETSKGTFDIKVTRELSPKAADRFYQLVKHRFFDDGLFYRVNPSFVAQFGGGNSIQSKKWNSIAVPDEIVIQGNQRGTLSFARGGKESRTTVLFINLGDNSRLDTLDYNEVKGFPSFGEVINGMNIVDSLYDGYADRTMSSSDLLHKDKTAFMEKFPKLDAIEKVYLVKE